MKKYDVVVIGGGSGGYTAAIRCAQLGLKTVLIEKDKNKKGQTLLGGTCLNVGCIPSKSLLESSAFFAKIKNESSAFGIKTTGLQIDVAAMQKRKNSIVDKLTSGIAMLLKSHDIEIINAKAKLLSNKRVLLDYSDNYSTKISAHSIIIATGSHPMELNCAKIDNEFIVNSTAALSWNSVPKNLGIIGAGAVGLEIGSIWARLGAKVTIFEALDFLSFTDTDVQRTALSMLRKQGLNIHLKTLVQEAKVENSQVTVVFQEDKKQVQKLVFDKLLVAAGRVPNSSDITSKDSQLVFDEGGYIHINEERGGTSIPGVYAIGDIVRGSALAHKASAEGIAVAERLAGIKTNINYNAIASVIYTEPEIAQVGKTSQQLKAEGINFKAGKFPFIANGRALAANTGHGFIKILSDVKTDQILGVHIIGQHSSEIIHLGVVAIEFEATCEDFLQVCMAHPSLSEAFNEAILDTKNIAINILRKL
ncbi:MAG: dihydrolipoyl dehydrogenase [Gammaproteobacteria bacterium]|nr:MAG: dihydrolipoyl dehydrogenase [Gammaproteobacteria bacterium]